MRIYELAKALDEPGLEAELGHRLVDEWLPGQYYFSAVSQLAMEGNQTAVALLVHFGAHITYIAIGAARGKNREWAEELRLAGADHHYIAMAAAMGEDREYVKFLHGLGAQNSFILKGAAFGGHREWVEELLLDCDIDDAIEFAAIGGHRKLAETLVGRAMANWGRDRTIAMLKGAAMGGFRDWVEEFSLDETKKDWVAGGAAMGGHDKWTEELSLVGANSNYICLGAARAGHLELATKCCSGRWSPSRLSTITSLSSSLIQGLHFPILSDIRSNIHIKPISSKEKEVVAIKTLRFLLALPPNVVPDFIFALRWDDHPIPNSIQKRAELLSRARDKNHLSFKTALWKTDPKNQGLLLMLTSLFVNVSSPFHTALPQLPKDLWERIFFLASDVALTRKGYEQLAFTTAKSMFEGSLKGYPGMKTKHNARATSFLKMMASTNELSSFAEGVVAQAERLKNPALPASSKEKYDQPLRNPTVDAYHTIIGFWANRFIPQNQKPYVFEEDPEQNNCTIF